MTDLPDLRADYGGGDMPLLTRASAGSDPMTLFDAWLEQAIARSAADSSREANAMALATCDANGHPSVRMVLLKGTDAARASFRFFTNLESRKAGEIAATGSAALSFWWPIDSRQVRVVGRVEPVDRAAAQAYFASRPRDSRIGSIASPQSREVADRVALDAAYTAAETAAGDASDGPVMPETWGGFDVIADEIEFWQGRHARLHDRLVFWRVVEGDERDEPESQWQNARLAP